MNFCLPNAYLVSAQGVIPSDASDYNSSNLPTLGCSRLHCRRCQRPVRNLAGRMAPRELTPAELSDLYALADPISSPLLLPAGKGRLYFCACEMWLERETHVLNESDPGPSDPLMSWHCQGHPIVSLPHTFEGMHVTDGAQLLGLFKAALQGIPPAGCDPDTAKDGLYATRLFMRMKNHPVAPSLARCADPLLAAPDVQTRANVLQFYIRAEDAQGRALVLQTLQQSPELLGLEPCSATGLYACSTLSDLAWLCLRSQKPASPAAQELARREALKPHHARVQLYLYLEEFDSSWMLQHAEEIVVGSPEQAAELVQRIGWLGKARRQDLKPLVTRIKARLQAASGGLG
jgi:hypothetical protein